MKKTYFLVFLYSIFFVSCTQEEQLFIGADSLNFRLYNYSDKSFFLVTFIIIGSFIYFDELPLKLLNIIM